MEKSLSTPACVVIKTFKFLNKSRMSHDVLQSIISEIETFHQKSKPMIKLLDFKNKYTFHASISHENDYAIAIVISELII